MTKIKLDMPFGQAIIQARRILGSELYYLHNQVGSHDWIVNQEQGRVYLQVKDPKIATFFLLQQ